MGIATFDSGLVRWDGFPLPSTFDGHSAPDPKPCDLDLTQTGPTTALLAWALVTGATSYNIYQNGVLLGTSQDGLSWNVTDLAPDTTYLFMVNAVINGIETLNGSKTLRFSSKDQSITVMPQPFWYKAIDPPFLR